MGEVNELSLSPFATPCYSSGAQLGFAVPASVAVGAQKTRAPKFLRDLLEVLLGVRDIGCPICFPQC